MVRRWWPHVRALLLLFHVLAVLVLSFPGPGKLADPRRWQSHRTQREIELWAQRLSAWGRPTRPQDLEAQLWTVAQRYLSVRRALAAPFEPYARIAGTPQTWGMFKAPPRQVSALRIDMHDGRAWVPLYRSRSDEHAYLRRELDHNRLRKQVGRLERDAGLFAAFSDWAARRTFADHPAAREVRVIVERHVSLSPAERRAGREPSRAVVRRRVVRRPQGT